MSEAHCPHWESWSTEIGNIGCGDVCCKCHQIIDDDDDECNPE